MSDKYGNTLNESIIRVLHSIAYPHFRILQCHTFFQMVNEYQYLMFLELT